MSAFTLDTSGAVSWPVRCDCGADCQDIGPGGGCRYLKSETRTVRWSDLSPFAQGYVEALLQALGKQRWAAYRASCAGGAVPHLPVPLDPAFSWLHPEALALILRDCEAMQTGLLIGRGKDAGREAWDARQAGWKDWGTTPRRDWPPLTPYLSDDGKVCLKVAA